MSLNRRSALEAMVELERRGDEAVSAGDFDEALVLYCEAQKRYLGVIDLEEPLLDQFGDGTLDLILKLLSRVRTKVDEQCASLRSSGDPAFELRTAVDAAMEEGNLAHASRMSFRLGEVLEESGDRVGAESAFRQAVALARQVDAADPELMLAAFSSLISFLAPSEESIALAHEMAEHLLNRAEMYHPMRAAEAARVWARAEVEHAEVVPNRLNHVINGIVRQALEALDDICLHEAAQELRHRVAAALRTVGREAEADDWCAEADKYGIWDCYSDQQIPGHVHLWDIRYDIS